MIDNREVTKIYLFMAHDLGLKGNEIILYSIIFNAGTKGYTSTQEQLGTICGITSKQVGLILKKLERNGLIESFKNTDRTNKAKTYKAKKLEITTKTVQTFIKPFEDKEKK